MGAFVPELKMRRISKTRSSGKCNEPQISRVHQGNFALTVFAETVFLDVPRRSSGLGLECDLKYCRAGEHNRTIVALA